MGALNERVDIAVTNRQSQPESDNPAKEERQEPESPLLSSVQRRLEQTLRRRLEDEWASY